MEKNIYEVKFELLKNVHDSYKNEYEQFLQKWRDIETKAQGTLNISGVLITLYIENKMFICSSIFFTYFSFVVYYNNSQIYILKLLTL